MKVMLILVDGMRPDSMKNIHEAQEFMKTSSYTLRGETVFPSVTLPCHMSLFHSVDPMRHGTTTNTYAPQVRPIEGLCEILKKHNKTAAFFIDWEELRDLARPGSLAYSHYVSGLDAGFDKADAQLAQAASEYLKNGDTADFIFLYQGLPDSVGHSKGWMSPEYLEAVDASWKRIKSVTDILTDEYVIFITADHGGHERMHGDSSPEDMTIPLIIHGKDFPKGAEIGNAHIIDVAPTIAKLLGASPSKEWEGKTLL